MDLINGLFEILGGLIGILNIIEIIKDKEIKGVNWIVTLFFTTWGIWNCFFYSNLELHISFFGGLVMTTVNLIWLYLAFKYRTHESSRRYRDT